MPPPAPPMEVPLDQLATLLKALVSTVIDVGAPRAARIAGTPAGVTIGPFVTVKSQGPINGAIGLGVLQPVVNNTPGGGAELSQDPRLRLSNPGDRRLQVRSWIEQLLLDNHYPAPSALLDSIVPSPPA
jgi:hypothetical protein